MSTPGSLGKPPAVNGPATPSTTAGMMLSVDLTPEQESAWRLTMEHMMWKAPGFRHLFYKLLAHNHKHGTAPYVAIFSRDIPTACTDGVNIIVNPDFFFGLKLAERTFVLCHEIMHNVYPDIRLMKACAGSRKVALNDGTALPYKPRQMNQAMDYRINPLLVESKLGKMPKNACYDLKIATAQDSVLDIYKKLHEDDEDGGSGPNGFDVILQPGKSAGPNAPTPNPQQWAIEVAVAKTLEERSRGNMPAGLKRMFDEILNPTVPWTDHIKGTIARIAGTGSKSWRRPDRRFIGRDLYLPSSTGFGASWVVVWGDTSGSIGDKEICSYMAELSAILEDVRPKRLTVLWCDAAIHNVDELEDPADLAAIRARGVGGRGGTSCHPVWKWIKNNGEEKPDMFIGFTDGEVDFPPEPDYPVIWASITDNKYPYGEVVRINKAGAI